MIGYAGTVALVLASPNSNDPGGQGPDFGKSSPLGLLLLILFFVAIAFLARSMNKHLRRVPASFDQPRGGPSAHESVKASGDAPKEQPDKEQPNGRAEAGGTRDKDKQARKPREDR